MRKRSEEISGSLPWILQKPIRLPLHVVAEFAGALIVLTLLIMKPFKNMKIFYLHVSRVGELAKRADLFLRRLELGTIKGDNIMYTGFVTTKCANEQLSKMYKREMFKRGILVMDDPLLAHMSATFLDYVLRGSLVLHKSSFYQDLPDTDVRLYGTKPIVCFTTAEEEKGKRLLRRMGINEDDWFICFNSRDSRYLDSAYAKTDWSYHSYRDCDIRNYMSAVEYIASKGGYAVRMGYYSAEKLPEPHNLKIIDYSFHYRTDFGDIYLPSRCKFFLGCTAGLFLVSTVFNVPVALANVVPLEDPGAIRRSSLFIPKKIWSVKEKRFLTFREILESGAGRYYRSEQFSKAGLEAVENTAEEILGLAKEMNERLDGTWVSTEEDEELQRSFRSLSKPHHLCYGFRSRVGTIFLRENKNLLE